LFFFQIAFVAFAIKYVLLRNAYLELIQRSVSEGLDHHIQKSDLLSLEEEQLILALEFYAFDSPLGLNN
jgi:hypothetical protein